MTRRDLEALPFRVLHRVRYPERMLPAQMRPVPMRDIRQLTLERPAVLGAIQHVAPTANDHLDEFTAFWDNEVLDTAISAHHFGEAAGVGPVDFAEAFTLYALIRERQPEHVLELGFASGISSWVLATALVANGSGHLDTVDIKDSGAIIPQFWELSERGVIDAHFGDAIEFVTATSQQYDLTFSDALHTREFNVRLATALRENLPSAVHCYHEWSLSPLTTTDQARHVSIRRHLGTCGEREAFEHVFGANYLHAGVPSSSGLGVVLPV